VSNTGDFDSFDDFASTTKDTSCDFKGKIASGIGQGVALLQEQLRAQLKPVTDSIASLNKLASTGLPGTAMGLLRQIYPLSSCPPDKPPATTGGIPANKCIGSATNFKCISTT
jgi:hypothetical protein